MKRAIFALFEASKIPLVRIWVDSWQARGWSPALISPREVEEAGSFRKAVAHRRGNAMSDLSEINFSGSPRGPLRSVRFGKKGWLTAPLVRFPTGTTEAEIYSCGRKLCLA